MADILTTLSTDNVLDLYKGNTPDVIDPLEPIAAELPMLMSMRTGIKGGFKGLILNEPTYVETGAKELCYNNAVSDTFKSRPFSFNLCDFESFAKFCPADLEKVICGNQSQGALRDLLYNGNIAQIGAGRPLGQVWAIALNLHEQRLRKDIIYQRTFGSKVWKTATSSTAGYRHNINNKLSTGYKTNFVVGNLGLCDSLWGILTKGATLNPGDAGYVKYVDSNGSSATQKYLNPQYTRDYADNLINGLDITVRNPSKVVFFIDPEMFKSLHRSINLALINTEAAPIMLAQGSVNIEVLEYQGYYFVPFYASETFDKEMDAMTTTVVPGRGTVTHSANLRAMALTVNNIITGVDIVESIRGAGMIVKRDPNERARGGFIVETIARRGLGIIEPELCLASWASNGTFA